MPYKDRARQREYKRLWIRQRRDSWLANHGPCVRCGSWADLQIDHVDPEQKVSHRIWSWSTARREIELAKCQVLCRGCHEKKTSEEKRTPIRHGTLTGYSKGCRCYDCGEARKRYRKKWGIDRLV